MKENGQLSRWRRHLSGLTRDRAFEGYAPEKVCLLLADEADTVFKTTVSEGEWVWKGQVIGEPEGAGACIHASITGVVESVRKVTVAPGQFRDEVCVRRQKAGTPRQPFAEPDNDSAPGERMRMMGLDPDRIHPARLVVVNGVSDALYVTSGYRLMMESPAKIVLGALTAALLSGAEQIRLYINEDDFEAIARMRQAILKYGQPADSRQIFGIVPMRFRYDCFRRWKAYLKKQEKAGESLCVSLAEAAALYDGFYDGEPLTEVGVTVSGAVSEPKNLWVPVGTGVAELLKNCGGVTADHPKIIRDGLLDGPAVDPGQARITRKTEGIFVAEEEKERTRPCIHCGKCRKICPVHLEPDRIERAWLDGADDEAVKGAEKCIGCGACSFVCPSRRRLSEYIHQAKKGRRARLSPLKDGDGERGGYVFLDGNGMEAGRIFEEAGHISHSPPHLRAEEDISVKMSVKIMALTPILAGAFWVYGWRSLFLTLFSAAVAAFCEYMWNRIRNEETTITDFSAILTGILTALLCPPDVPFWKAGAAAAASILIGKALFGGLGKSPIQPSIVGKLLMTPARAPMIGPLGLYALPTLAILWWKRQAGFFMSLAYAGLLILGGFPAGDGLTLLASAYYIQNDETSPAGGWARWARVFGGIGITLFLSTVFQPDFSVLFGIFLIDLLYCFFSHPTL